MSDNNITFLSTIVQELHGAGIDIFVFGGWAEQLRRMRQPGSHTDIDLLIRAMNFNQLETFMSEKPLVSEIQEKQFSHKRAFEWNGVRIEFILVKPNAPDETIFFDGHIAIYWPADTFSELPVWDMPVASKAALNMYRRRHKQVEIARIEFYESYAKIG